MQMIGFALVMLMEDKGLALQLTFLLVGIWWIALTLRARGRTIRGLSLRWRVAEDTE